MGDVPDWAVAGCLAVAPGGAAAMLARESGSGRCSRQRLTAWPATSRLPTITDSGQQGVPEDPHRFLSEM